MDNKLALAEDTGLAVCGMFRLDRCGPGGDGPWRNDVRGIASTAPPLDS